MKAQRQGRAAGVLLALSALLVLVSAAPAQAHTHPTPVELDAPAVVQVRTDAVVDISLIEHHQAGGAPHIGLFQKTYQVPLTTNSGFAVDPTGAVVTTRRAVDVELHRAEVYAVNAIFHDRYADRAPLPADPYQPTRITDSGAGEALNPRLQQCYSPNTTGESGGCVVATTRLLRVLPFVTDQRLFGDLTAEVLPAAPGSEVAVLHVGASSMPTVRLASALEGTAYSVMGFTQTPVDAASESVLQGHFVTAGQPQVKADEFVAAQLAALQHGAQGGPVVSDKGEVLGFLLAGGGGSAGEAPLTLVGPDKIRAALKQAAVTPHTGPTDAVYEAASHDYKNALYRAALPNLEQTLKLYPGHALASAAQADAQAKQGTAADRTGKDVSVGSLPADRSATTSGGHGGLLLPSMLAAGSLLLLLLVVLLLRRRARAAGTAAGTAAAAGPDGPAPPAPAPTPAAAPAPGPGLTVAAPAPARPPVADSRALTLARAAIPDQLPGSGDDPSATLPPGRPAARARAAAGGETGLGGTAAEVSSVRPASTGTDTDTGSGSGTRSGTGSGPVLGVVPRPAPATGAERRCRVCADALPSDVEYCESCGYRAT